MSCSVVRSEFSLINHLSEFLFAFGNVLKPLPTWFIYCTRYWIVYSYNPNGFICDLPIVLMGNNASNSPLKVRVFILSDVHQHFVVSALCWKK
jgi:hypothetical protein